MKKLQFIKPISGEEEGTSHLEVLLDPIRSKILLEVILNADVTAEKLMIKTQKSRSTISHHLKKLVESGIIEVYMNPTGKIKYYQLNRKFANRFYSLDKEALKTSSLEESSKFIVELQQMIAMMSHVYSNIFSEQIKELEEKTPFEKVDVDEKGDITYVLDGEKRKMPYTSSFITGKKEAEFLTKGLNKLMDDFQKEFGNPPEAFLNLDSKPTYLFNAHLFPYYSKEEKQ